MELILLLLVCLFLAYVMIFQKEGVKGVKDVPKVSVRDYFLNNGSIKPYPGASGLDFVTAFKNEDEGLPEYQGIKNGFDKMIEAIDGASKMYGIQKTVLASLVMTESQGDWNAVGDSGYWDFAQIKYVLDAKLVPESALNEIKNIFEDRSISPIERRNRIRDYLQTNFPEVYNILPTRRASFGSGQLFTWKCVTDPGHWSTFDIISRANSAREWIRKHGFHVQETRDNHVVEIYNHLEVNGNAISLRHRGIFDPEFNVYVMAYLLNKNINIALSTVDYAGNTLNRDEWAVLAGLFKYKNGSSAPTNKTSQNPYDSRKCLIRDKYNIKDWWYRALIEHGDKASDPYMSHYDQFLGYFDTFNTHYFNLTGEYLIPPSELEKH